MKTFKALYRLAIIVGILILGVGTYLQLTNQSTTGNSSQYDGTPLSQTLDGLSTIYLGIIVLLIALLTYFMYKRELRQYRKLDEDA